MSDVHYKKHRVFRETDDVIFYDISVDESNASDLVVHNGPAMSPPNDCVGAKQFYVHSYQDDYNRVVSGQRTFELVNYEWRYPYHIVNLNVHTEHCLYLVEHIIGQYQVKMGQSSSIKPKDMMDLIQLQSSYQYRVQRIKSCMM